MIWLVLVTGLICLGLAIISGTHPIDPDPAIAIIVAGINHALTLIGLGCIGYFIVDSLFSGPKKPKNKPKPRWTPPDQQ